MNGPGGVDEPHDVGHVAEVLAHVGFVAQRPDYDGRMVFVALDHCPAPRHKRIPPFGFSRRGLAFAPQVMAFDIGFVDNVQAQFVAQVVPVRYVGIVRRSDGVDVVLFHQFDVPDHGFAADDPPRIGIELVAVDALKGYGFAVNQQLTVG